MTSLILNNSAQTNKCKSMSKVKRHSQRNCTLPVDQEIMTWNRFLHDIDVHLNMITEKLPCFITSMHQKWHKNDNLHGFCFSFLSIDSTLRKLSHAMYRDFFSAVIRAVTGQRSSPDLCFATKFVKIYDP